MEKAWKRYYTQIQGVLESVRTTQEDNIEKAADILAECTKNEGIIRCFGVGHSGVITEDVHWRASTLSNVQSITEIGLSGTREVTKSQHLEKLAGYGKILVDYHRIKPPDALIAVSSSGNNAVTIDVAHECRARGVKVIAITGVDYSDGLNALHPDGTKLKDNADVVLDSHVLFGDAAVDIEGFKVKTGPTSAVPAIFLLNAILVQAVENLVLQGFEPDVYFAGNLEANLEEVSEHNKRLIDKYFYKIRNL